MSAVPRDPLDVDEELVHELRSRFVLETFMRHDMAPVAGGITDREQNGFPLACACSRAWGSFFPMNWIILMLQEIGAGRSIKLVAGHGVS